MWQQHGVAVPAQRMALGGELGVQRVKVVDLAVEDGGDRAAFVGRRLEALVEVDHGEAPMPERGPPGDRDTAVIRAAMADRVGHAADYPRVRWAERCYKSADAAHGLRR